ncbi:MAG: redoxin domain-containing protein [Prolixibacteraceae bacterium]|nr:redoxin domain-containing protein [Prolixibacteraceae bacterium]MBN2650587.1 redoxin domain-containing protein [Prolixibacteraceae bacterium]
MKHIIVSIILLFNLSALEANNSKIEIKWNGMNDSTIYLAHYFDTNIYVNDTIKLNNKGEGTFASDSLLDQGLYLVYQSADNYFDFLIGSEQNLKIEASYPVSIDEITIEGAEVSEKFAEYQKMVKAKMEQKRMLSETINTTNNDTERDEAREAIQNLDDEIKQFMQREIAANETNMYGIFLNAANSIEIPAPQIERNHPKYDSIAWFHQYNYNRDHYLDGIDFSDKRLLNTPLLHSKLNTYFNRILIQAPDSIIPQIKKVLTKAESSPEMYRYVSQFLLNNSTQSKIMGMDAVFVAIADEVYLSGKAFWADKETLKKIEEEAYLTRPNLIGNTAPELVMEDINGEYKSLHEIMADYTILVFFEYDCGHCKRDIPGLYNNVYMKYIDKNIEVYAVMMNDDKEKWTEFVNENEINGWYNVWDPDHSTQFRFKYNIKMTPLIYLLDKDKKIIAKKIDQENLVRLIESLLKE